MGRPSSLLAGIFFVAAVALGYLYLSQRAEMGLIRAELAEKSSHEEQNRRQLAEFQQKLAAANAAAKKAEEELTAQDRAASARPAAPANGKQLSQLLDLERDPAYVALQKRQMRRIILRQYGDALASLNLPPDQLSQLKDLLAGRIFSSGDPRLAGMEPGTPAYNQELRAASQAISQQIDALIGPDGQRKLQAAQMLTTSQNQVANNYAPDFADAGVPLTPDQSTSLAQLLNPMNNPGGGRAMNQADPETFLSPRDEQLLDQAAQILSPPQIAILKADRAEQNQRQALMRQYTAGTNTVQSTTTVIGP